MPDLLQYCLKKAKALPLEGNRQRLWACVTDKRGNILGEGCNSFVKSSVYQKQMAAKAGKPKCEYLHAELASLTRVFRSKSKAKPHALWVARALRNGEHGLAKPCEVCQLAIAEAGIKNVFYSE